MSEENEKHEHHEGEKHVHAKEEHKKHEHQHESEKHVHSKKPKIKKIQIWQAATLIAVILLIFFWVKSSNCSTGMVISAQEAAENAVSYINQNLMQPGTEAELTGAVSEKSGLYVFTITVAGREYDSYVSKDGDILFPSAFDMTEEVETVTPTEQPASQVPKKDKPEVELFVMSHCPYGTQAEKGILPVTKLLGDKIDFNVRFVYYAMHGKTEVDEELSQYCIQKEQRDKYYNYLMCFLKEGKSAECLTEAKIDKTKLDACIEQTDKEFKVTEQYNDKSTWLSGNYPLIGMDKELNQKYGVGGSPTLVINGQTVSSARDSASLLATICASFTEQPEECGQVLSSTAPSPGFGFSEGTAATTDASCG